jgi:two-component system NarL family sensor kinase
MMSDPADQLLNVLENERCYVAREMHDGVAQTTLQLGLQASICQMLLERGNLDMLARELAQLEERLQLASRQVREMINDMRPPLVAPEATLDDYLRSVIETHHQRGGPPVAYRFEVNDEVMELTTAQVLALARAAQEALLNIRKHAKAEQSYLTVIAQADRLSITIGDDGQGFDPAEVESRPTDKGGAGLANLRARVEASGGTFELTSGGTGKGTEIIIKLPK